MISLEYVLSCGLIVVDDEVRRLVYMYMSYIGDGVMVR